MRNSAGEGGEQQVERHREHHHPAEAEHHQGPKLRILRHADDHLDARGRMLVAAAMGAVSFQKDLGVVHSMAHPLSTVCGLHHGRRAWK